MSLCIRYITKDDQKFEVHEDFLGFAELQRMDAETIASAINEKLKVWGLPMDNMRGNGFDGASTMSGDVSGVQTRLTEMYTKAKYFTHCPSHRLNLVIVASCKNVPDIRNFMTSFQQLTFFLKVLKERQSCSLICNSM